MSVELELAIEEWNLKKFGDLAITSDNASLMQ